MNWENLEVYCTTQDQYFKIQILNLSMNCAKNLCPNLNFTVKNKMGNTHKKGWSHLNLTQIIKIFHFLKF